MTKNITKYLSALLALLLMFSMVAALAETETEQVVEDYESLNKDEHTIHYTTWEYPIVDGERASGKPVEEGTYTEEHTIEDGKCVYCGYEEKVVEKSETAAAEETADTEETAEDNFETATGVVVVKGSPAATVLKDVLAAIPADAEIAIPGVDASVVEDLIALINGNPTAAEILEFLANAGFPIQTVDGVECYVVTLQYADANGNPVTENYAFSTEDATLVSVF